MLLALGGLAAASIYWLLVPARFRTEAMTLLSLVGLALLDLRLPPLLLALVALLFACTQAMAKTGPRGRHVLQWVGFLGLGALFLYNKLSWGAFSFDALPIQGGLVFLGISYLVLKAMAVLIEARRGALERPAFGDLLRWIVFLPIYPSGPIEEFKHFVRQEPVLDRDQVLGGMERILIGLVKSLLVGRFLGEWTDPIVMESEGYAPAVLFLVAIAQTARVYFDFSGYSDIAIGLAAIYGYEIQENFNYPLFQRNIGAVWQSWHMTLTGWLRTYLFIPLSRSLMRRGARWDGIAIVAGHLWSLTFCALWHGFRWEFLLWGFLQSLGLIWIGLGSRRAGTYLPRGFVAWWRRSRIGYGLSCFLAVSFFSLVNLFAIAEGPVAFAFLARIAGLG